MFIIITQSVYFSLLKQEKLRPWTKFHYVAVHRYLDSHIKRYSYTSLKFGNPTAHKMSCLMLLPSGPDMVHNVLLHRTELSTREYRRQTLMWTASKTDLGPARADCRYRVPLLPHLARYLT